MAMRGETHRLISRSLDGVYFEILRSEIDTAI